VLLIAGAVPHHHLPGDSQGPDAHVQLVKLHSTVCAGAGAGVGRVVQARRL